MKFLTIILLLGLYSAAVETDKTPEHRSPAREKFPSLVPKQTFSQTPAEQEKEHKANELMCRFAASRKKLSADRYRPAYHFVSPESTLNDPNGLCFWQGRWHLFYQAYPLEDPRQHWGHTVSDDLIHWRDLPYAIYPGIERMCFSGGTVVENKQVVAFYPGIDAGMMVAVSRDPLLLNWEKIPGNPVAQPARDSCIWKQGDTYLGLLGSNSLLSSTDLVNWNTANANVLRSPNAGEHTAITFYNYDQKVNYWLCGKSVISLDGSRSSTLPDVLVRPRKP